MIEKNLKKTDLARLLACHMPQIDRLLDLNHESRLEQLERALAAIGRYVVIEVHDLAA